MVKNIFIEILSVQKLQNLQEMQTLAPGTAPVAASDPCESVTEMTVSRLSIRRVSAAPGRRFSQRGATRGSQCQSV